MNNLLTIIVIVGDEPEMITDCLKSCLFADKLVVVTTLATTKETISKINQVSKNITFKKANNPGIDFSYWRNAGTTNIKTKWVLFVDADERITPELKSEIGSYIQDPKQVYTNFDIPRANYFLGKRVRYGNSYPDYVKRLFLISKFKGYQGKLHEQPLITGPSQKLKSTFNHYTHRQLSTMLTKSLSWTPLESQLLFDSNHPKIVWWRIIRMMLTKLWERLIKEQMYRDGTVGWISAIFEMFDTFLIYSQLWEIQNNKSLNKVI